MKVIMQANVYKLGNIGSIVSVSRGYARNYLIPKNLAQPATTEHIAEFEKNRAVLEKEELKKQAAAEQLAEKIKTITLTSEQRATHDGKLFGSITVSDIIDLYQKEGVELQRIQVKLAKTIRTCGEHPFSLHIYGNIVVESQITVTSQA